MGAAFRRCLAGKDVGAVSKELVDRIGQQRVKAEEMFNEASQQITTSTEQLEDLRREMRAVVARSKSLKQTNIPADFQLIHKFRLARIMDSKSSAHVRMERSVAQQRQLDSMLEHAQQATTIEEFTTLQQQFANVGRVQLPSKKKLKRTGEDLEAVVNLITDATEDSAESANVLATSSVEMFDSANQSADAYSDEYEKMMREVFNEASVDEDEEEVFPSTRVASRKSETSDDVASAAASRLRREALARA